MINLIPETNVEEKAKEYSQKEIKQIFADKGIDLKFSLTPANIRSLDSNPKLKIRVASSLLKLCELMAAKSSGYDEDSRFDPDNPSFGVVFNRGDKVYQKHYSKWINFSDLFVGEIRITADRIMFIYSFTDKHNLEIKIIGRPPHHRGKN